MPKMDQVFYVSASPAWEVYEFRVFTHPRERGKFFTYTGAGCSCYMYEPPTVREGEAETPLGKREVYAKFSQWWDSTSPANRHGTKVDILQRLRGAL